MRAKLCTGVKALNTVRSISVLFSYVSIYLCCLAIKTLNLALCNLLSISDDYYAYQSLKAFISVLISFEEHLPSIFVLLVTSFIYHGPCSFVVLRSLCPTFLYLMNTGMHLE
jgi:hypothetical protein